jgi:hypothetical protein
MSTEEMWDTLRDEYGVSEETLQVVSNGWGFSRDTMETVLYAVAGERGFDDDDDQED